MLKIKQLKKGRTGEKRERRQQWWWCWGCWRWWWQCIKTEWYQTSRIWGIIGHLSPKYNYVDTVPADRTLRLLSTVHTFTRNFERLGVFINEHSNARISNLSKINPVPCERCLHPSEKVQEPTSLWKSTGAYIPRKCKGAYIPKKGTGAKSLGNVKGPTPPGKDTGAYFPRKWRGS